MLLPRLAMNALALSTRLGAPRQTLGVASYRATGVRMGLDTEEGKAWCVGSSFELYTHRHTQKLGDSTVSLPSSHNKR